MKGSELIKKLMDLYLEHGDIEVMQYNWDRMNLQYLDDPRIEYKVKDSLDIWDICYKDYNKGDKIIVI